ncbi:hypothetical protein ACN27F_26175 [Solwaraspora sp. WMMB335]
MTEVMPVTGREIVAGETPCASAISAWTVYTLAVQASAVTA